MVDQGIAIEKHIGGTLMDYDQGLATGRSDCYQALGWLIFHGGSPDVAIDGVNFPLLKLSRVFMRARMDEIAKAEAALKEAEAPAEAGAGTAAPRHRGRNRRPRALPVHARRGLPCAAARGGRADHARLRAADI